MILRGCQQVTAKNLEIVCFPDTRVIYCHSLQSLQAQHPRGQSMAESTQVHKEERRGTHRSPVYLHCPVHCPRAKLGLKC